MKKRSILSVLLGLVGLCLLVNSCKKDSAGTVDALLARGTWQLASVLRYNYVGSSNTSIDTLNTACNSIQTFTFNADNTCTYTDFSCLPQTAKGSWQLAEDKLTLFSSMTVQDTLAGTRVTAKPFTYARIINLGQFSMVIETGDLSSYYLSTDKRHIKRYGFIRN